MPIGFALAIWGMTMAGAVDERTCFQTGQPYADWMNVRSQVAIVYGIDKGLPARIETWRRKGYRIHVMTGVAWGNYQDYLYGRFDGRNHEDEAQTDRNGERISHGGDVYYMSPGESYGKFLCVGVKRALDAGAEAIHLEEPEFWVRGGYSESFKREYKSLYGSDWIPPHASCEAQWRASKLKYFLYRRALQQVFDFVQAHNKEHGRSVKCYVPTHSLLNYAHWQIVSPESSLARLNGCDGYIAQVWTGTSRTPNVYRGEKKERTFETAFLEYGAMQNLVRSTGRRVWYLNDPVEDDASHDWGDYRRNWECTLTASLLQPEVDHYEVMPWPERVWGDRYPSEEDPSKRVKLPAAYATELQVVCRALGEMDKAPARWTCGTRGIGVIVSDSLMFQRSGPGASDGDMSHVYGLTMPLLKRGVPVEPVQLENVAIPRYLRNVRVLVLSYRGQKPLTPDVHRAIARWVASGGRLLVVDDLRDPFNEVPEWWNTSPLSFASPVEHLFQELGVAMGNHDVGKGTVAFLRLDPAACARDRHAEDSYVDAVGVMAGNWAETNHLLLRRGKYVVAAGMDESPAGDKTLTVKGRFVNLFDPSLALRHSFDVAPGARLLLLDLDKAKGDGVLAAACHTSSARIESGSFECTVEGVAGTNAVVLLRLPFEPKAVLLGGKPVSATWFDKGQHLLWVKFANRAEPRELRIHSDQS